MGLNLPLNIGNLSCKSESWCVACPPCQLILHFLCQTAGLRKSMKTRGKDRLGSFAGRSGCSLSQRAVRSRTAGTVSDTASELPRGSNLAYTLFAMKHHSIRIALCVFFSVLAFAQSGSF